MIVEVLILCLKKNVFRNAQMDSLKMGVLVRDVTLNAKLVKEQLQNV
jgi:hypothetical protein